ncbi:hypothetical protein TrRE_jg2935 [Triparma retinervis]|uniref:Uncharacterized protein n=1 Tax=Triparma retinervis TaxID=2557542 RepID=A0A9W7AFE4_9STRA|nr:hypothetical protein TrRE_jg2935 [Triparma retinervis]
MDSPSSPHHHSDSSPSENDSSAANITWDSLLSVFSSSISTPQAPIAAASPSPPPPVVSKTFVTGISLETLDPRTSTTLYTPSDASLEGGSIVARPITAIKSSDLPNLFALELTLQRIYTTTVQVEILPGNEGRVRNPSTKSHLRLEDFHAGYGLVTLEWELDDEEGAMRISFKGGGVSLSDISFGEDDDGDGIGDGFGDGFGNGDGDVSGSDYVSALLDFMFDM